MVECYFYRQITGKLYECIFPALCAFQTPLEGSEKLYCIPTETANKQEFIESELEKFAKAIIEQG